MWVATARASVSCAVGREAERPELVVELVGCVWGGGGLVDDGDEVVRSLYRTARRALTPSMYIDAHARTYARARTDAGEGVAGVGPEEERRHEARVHAPRVRHQVRPLPRPALPHPRQRRVEQRGGVGSGVGGGCPC